MNDFLLRMKSLLGDEFDEFLKFYNSDDFIKGLRVNTLKCLPEKRYRCMRYQQDRKEY